MPHFTVDHLRACCAALAGTTAPGVEGVTKAMYAQPLEEHLQELHQKLRHMASRPQPVRRGAIPKEDGTMRPLGSSCTEDTIGQERARRLRDARYEPVFLDTSDDFRPGRRCHDALRRLNAEVRSGLVNWIAELEIAPFFDTRPQTEGLAVLPQRITDTQCLRLIARMRQAGGQTPDGVGYDELGSP